METWGRVAGSSSGGREGLSEEPPVRPKLRGTGRMSRACVAAGEQPAFHPAVAHGEMGQ